MKNIESCTLAMMESPSPPSLKETDGSTNDEPLESPLKKIDSSSAEVDSTTIDPEENGHSEVKEKASSEDDAPVTNGNKETIHENGKDKSEENGLQTPKSPEQRPEPDKSLDSEISALVETIDTDMKDDSECNDSSSEDSDDKTKGKSSEVTETIPETEITSSSTKESAEKMDSSESEKEPAQKSEICLEPASASSQSDSEDSEEEKSKTVESTNDKPDEDASIKPEEKAEPVKPEKDYKAALDELTSIAQNAKKINDDDLLGIKKAEGECLYCLKQ